jgi:glycosyltransferase involved in cell wall biosynthesis
MTGAHPPRRQHLRVLHVIQNLNYGGMERMIADLVRHADPSIESHVLVLQYRGRFAEDMSDTAVVHQSPPMTRWSMLRPRTLERAIRGIAPDVVHSHSGVWFKASLAARMAGVSRVIHTEHGRPLFDRWHVRWLDGLAAARTDVAVAVSASVAKMLEAGIVRGRCAIEQISNGVDTERFSGRGRGVQLRAVLGVRDDVTVIGSIGRLEHIKGYDVMIDAFAALLRDSHECNNAMLVIAGDGSERPALEARIARYGLSDRVRLLGWRDDVEDLLSAFDCFTMSSRSEGTSISLLEAMSAGLCPIVTDVGGNRDVLGPTLAHRIVPRERPTDLSEAWRDAIVSRERRTRDGREARAQAVARFSIKAMADAYAALYANGVAVI